jgi:hypothetical protein
MEWIVVITRTPSMRTHAYSFSSLVISNHFRQSYMMQFHKIMYPVFARVGVKLITRNMAQGGLGTIQAGMGSGSIYGNEVDLLLWDSGKCRICPWLGFEPTES